MRNIYYLNPFIRYRIEKNKIFLTDCLSLSNYNLPMKSKKILDALKDGCDVTNFFTSKFNKLLIEDLIDLNIISPSKRYINSFNSKIFEKMENF